MSSLDNVQLKHPRNRLCGVELPPDLTPEQVLNDPVHGALLASDAPLKQKKVAVRKVVNEWEKQQTQRASGR